MTNKLACGIKSQNSLHCQNSGTKQAIQIQFIEVFWKIKLFYYLLPRPGAAKIIHLTYPVWHTRYRRIFVRQILKHSASKFHMDHSGAQAQPQQMHILAPRLSVSWVSMLQCRCTLTSRKYMALQEMLGLFPPCLIPPFVKRLWRFVCGPTDCSGRCMEQHSWLPSPHEPSISITIYDCSQHISYRATWETLTAAYTLTSDHQSECYSHENE
jgi:hypothetical protein